MKNLIFFDSEDHAFELKNNENFVAIEGREDAFRSAGFNTILPDDMPDDETYFDNNYLD